MANEPTFPQIPNLAAVASHHRGWFSALGVLSIVVGLMAISFPLIMTIAIGQVIGIFCVITGVFSLGAVLFGQERSHRFASALFALLRIAIGLSFIIWFQTGVLALTLFVAALFLAEGVVGIITSFRLKPVKGWVWVLLNGIVTLILGIMILDQWPSNAAWVLGLLYGIYAIFEGAALLGLALGSPKAT